MSLEDATLHVGSGRVRLGSVDVALRVTNAPLTARSRTIHGSWDPLLKRVELFNAAARSDAELIETLVHEVAHASGEAEEPARRIGRAWVSRNASHLPSIAATLRRVAGD